MIKVGIECESIEDNGWGLGRVVTQILKEINERPELKSEFKFFLYFKRHIPDLPFLDNPIFEKKLIRLPWQWFSSFSLYYYILLPVYLWFHKLDIVFLPNYMLPILFRGKSIVHMTNDIYYEMRSPAQKLRHRVAYRIFVNWAVKHATHLMTLSHAAKKDIAKLFKIDSRRITVNHLGIDIMERAIGLKDKECEGDDSNKYIACIAQAFPRRHARELILAFKKISKDFPELKLHIVGGDKYRPPILDSLIKKINSELGSERITRKDYIEKDEVLIRLYKYALLTVYVSDSEAFGLPPLEALALGSIPVVADNALSHELYGDNAFFVQKLHNVDAMADALRESLTNTAKREKIKDSADEITKRFTWSQHTERFLQLCKDVAK
ncbi:MAG: glycosyltransferase family 1 protein [Parcubacteria group bacterium]